jgi:hypothetical protein
VSVYGQKVFSRKEVSVWRNKFKNGRMTLNDDLQKYRGRPGTSHTDENYVIVEGLKREARRVEDREIAEVAGIAKKALFMKSSQI